MNILTAQALQGKPTVNEQVLQAILLVCACFFPGLPAVLIGAYISAWVRIPRRRRDLLILGGATLLGGLAGLAFLPVVVQTIAQLSSVLFAFDVQSILTDIGKLWLLGLPFAPLVGVVLTVWREVQWEVFGVMRSFDEFMRRSLRQDERRSESANKHAASRADEITESGRPGEVLLGAAIPGSDTSSLPAELGINVRGDTVSLAEWVQNTHMLVMGSTGEGKTETLVRLMYENIKYTNRRLVVVDGKGDSKLAERFRDLVWTLTRTAPPVFRLGYGEPGAVYNGFSGSADAIFSRMCAMVGVENVEIGGGEDYFKRLNAKLLWLICKAPGGPPRSFTELEARLNLDNLAELWKGKQSKLDAIEDIRKEKREFKGLKHLLDTIIWEFEDQVSGGGFSLDDTPYALFSLKTGGAGFTSKLLLKFLIEDLKDYLSTRQEVPTTIIIDEFSAFGNKNIVTILNLGRSAGLGVVLAAQGMAGLGDEETKQHIIEGTRTKILMSIEDPEEIARLAGTVKALEVGQQFDQGAATGMGTVREQDQFAIDMNEAAQLPIGQAFVIRKRHKVRVGISRVMPNLLDKAPTVPVEPEQPPEVKIEPPADGPDTNLAPW